MNLYPLRNGRKAFHSAFRIEAHLTREVSYEKGYWPIFRGRMKVEYKYVWEIEGKRRKTDKKLGWVTKEVDWKNKAKISVKRICRYREEIRFKTRVHWMNKIFCYDPYFLYKPLSLFYCRSCRYTWNQLGS